MTFEETVQKIKNLEIQGAEKIAVAAVEAFALKLKTTSDRAVLQKAFDELSAARATEPALRNALRYCLENYEKNPEVGAFVVSHFKTSKRKIAQTGAEKIRNGMIIFTHCHSSTVEAILAEAKSLGKNVTVYNTETRPRFQGRITAQNIAKLGIPVVHFVDSAAHQFIKKADLFLFGCDAVTAEGKIINKIGTQAIAGFAKQLDIPVYSCTNSWKFDPLTAQGIEEVIEERDPQEVWKNPPPGVTVKNPAFEIIPPTLVTGMITELGIIKPELLITKIKTAYPWMLQT
jgi:ribose 1,5-bisphosphate isomerase